jgi:hypothetical protein
MNATHMHQREPCVTWLTCCRTFDTYKRWDSRKYGVGIVVLAITLYIGKSRYGTQISKSEFLMDNVWILLILLC